MNTTEVVQRAIDIGTGFLRATSATQSLDSDVISTKTPHEGVSLGGKQVLYDAQFGER